MIAMLITALLACVVAGIFLKNAIYSLMLIGLVVGIYVLSCYAFDVSPRALLSEGIGQARHEYRAHVPAQQRREIREWL